MNVILPTTIETVTPEARAKLHEKLAAAMARMQRETILPVHDGRRDFWRRSHLMLPRQAE